MKRRLLLLPLLISTLLPMPTRAAPPAVRTLWPEGVPPARRAEAPAARGDLGPERVDANGAISNVSVPTLTVVPPAVDRPNGTAVILCPGGGYTYLSWQREGLQYAAWLSTLGITTFILKSRLKEWGHPAPLQDVLRAVRLVRSRAAEFGVDPKRIGVMGSSAGGHLAASASTLWDHPDGRAGAALDRSVSARPDFAVLVYPVITMMDPAAHAGSRQALLGTSPGPELLTRMTQKLFGFGDGDFRVQLAASVCQKRRADEAGAFRCFDELGINEDEHRAVPTGLAAATAAQRSDDSFSSVAGANLFVDHAMARLGGRRQCQYSQSTRNTPTVEAW